MADLASTEMRRRLVAHLRRRGFLHDQRVGRAFLAIPREAFLPDELRRSGLQGVYRDDAIVTRRDPATRAPTSSSSQPAIMAVMLEMLDVQPGHRVLEIGAGSGYNAALLSHLASPGGFVVTVDIEEEVARSAAAALRRVGSSARVVVADGTQGMPALAAGEGRGVDRLEVTASCDTVPRAWHEQMALGGRLVVPLRLTEAVERPHAVTAFVKVDQGFESVAVTSGGFMPLRRPDRGRAPEAVAPEAVAAEPRAPEAERPTRSVTQIWPRQGKSPTSTQQPAPSPTRRLGHGHRVVRDELSRLHIVVRYDGRRPSSRWAIERDDHWIGIDELTVA